ncbi:hypothetical protein HDK90DRAFT_78811 [Phyllosticta capitalensis]|uniref:Uncharacterized protein n=1 Tax=Phyllosticta capitalensis TaxID=121624 RepID=A0ABR1YDC4_9PEZI
MIVKGGRGGRSGWMDGCGWCLLACWRAGGERSSEREYCRLCARVGLLVSVVYRASVRPLCSFPSSHLFFSFASRCHARNSPLTRRLSWSEHESVYGGRASSSLKKAALPCSLRRGHVGLGCKRERVYGWLKKAKAKATCRGTIDRRRQCRAKRTWMDSGETAWDAHTVWIDGCIGRTTDDGTCVP